jgi:hypothetical protein
MGDIDGTIKKGVKRMAVIMGIACLSIIIISVVIAIYLVL